MLTKRKYKTALKYAKKVYIRHTHMNSIEILLIDRPNEQVLAVAGSNDKIDWFFNFLLLSWKKIKLGAYLKARRIKGSNAYKKWRDLNKPLLITGHSEGGTTAPAFFKLYCNPEKGDTLIYFNPCPSVRKSMPESERSLKNSALMYNQFDAVHYAGELSFDHWNVDALHCNNKNRGGVAENHTLNQWDEYIQEQIHDKVET